jgi:hypothetical protein
MYHIRATLAYDNAQAAPCFYTSYRTVLHAPESGCVWLKFTSLSLKTTIKKKKQKLERIRYYGGAFVQSESVI